MTNENFVYGRATGTEAAVACVRDIYEAFARRDLEAVLALMAADFELVALGTARLVGRSAPYRGHLGVRDYLDDVARVWQDLTLHADDIRAVGDSVIVFGHVRGRSGDGEEITRRAVWTWKLRHGKAVSVRVADVGDA